jgi:membrane protein DedA with SNARE-associated domain
VLPPLAGAPGLPAPRPLIPIALASGLWYGALTFFVVRLGTNLDGALAALGRVNRGLGAVALGLFIFLAVWIVRRLKR